MQTEIIAELFYDLYFMETINIYPGNGRFVLEGKALFNSLYFSLFKLSFVIIDNANPDPFSLLFSYVNEGTRRQPRFSRPSFN